MFILRQIFITISLIFKTIENEKHLSYPRTLVLTLFFSFMLTLSHAQGNSNRDFWKKITERELNMDSRNQQKLERMKTDTMYSSVEPVKFDKISSFIKKGKLFFKHPKDNETLVAIPTHKL